MFSRRLVVALCAIGTATIFMIDNQMLLLDFATSYTRSVSISHLEATESGKMGDRLHSWPPLSELVDEADGMILQDVQFLMDFAIIGHPKTATTFTLNWLHGHEEIEMDNREWHFLQQGHHADLVKNMYNLSPGKSAKRGYKAPRDIHNPKVLAALATYWPETKLVVGLRSPVLWFQSFYNYRVSKGYEMPPPETLVGPCRRESYGVCPDEALFHLHLSYFGKTNRTTQEELELLQVSKTVPNRTISTPPPNPIFLYEISQIHDADPARADQYRKDLSRYLGLSKDLPKVDHPRTASTAGGNVFNICEDEYVELRVELMKHSRAASLWIRRFFLGQPGVEVSSRPRFEELLETWMIDPCEESSALE